MVNVDKLEILNRRIEIYKSSELIKMHINKPNEQRIINNNKVNEIIEYQLNYLKNISILIF